ncbi:MAG: ATP-binding protein, partial [Candidatus Acidiferrales bacterium]
EEQRDFSETIRSAADALLAIINDILDFSKIEAGKLELEMVDFDLNDLIESTVELFAEQAQSKKIELVYWIKSATPTQLRGDPGRIRQVLTNLLANAVKFTEQGEVVLEIEAEQEEARHASVRFSIRDTGIGVAWAAQPRLFEAFTQGDGSLTRKFGRTGLGLAISKQLVLLLDGRINFKSAPGQGSTFWFTLPLEKQEQPRSDGASQPCLEGVRVLIVDDNSTNRQILHHQVVSWKMRNGAADGGAEALRILETAAAQGDPYDLVILDMQMPEMDGLQVAQAIAQNPKLSATRVVVLTSLGYHLPPHDLERARISAYLVKPVKPSRLFDCLAGLMDVVRNQPPASPAETQRRPPVEPGSIRVLVAEDNPVNQKVTLR